MPPRARPEEAHLLRFPEAYRFLSSRKRFGGGRGLDPIRRSLAEIGDPHLSFRAIHVAGTNGKGSVAATLDALLRAAGWRTGLYTSPHLLEITERVRVDGVQIGAAPFARAVGEVADVIRRDDLTFFEAITLVAFHLFRECAVEIAVVETGLGGRLDATNLLEPEVGVVTNIGRDHTAVLGEAPAQRAREKLGIAKRGVPLLTGTPPAQLGEVFRRETARVGAPLHFLDDEASMHVREISVAGVLFDLTTPGGARAGLRSPLTGAHQVHNAALAIRALELFDPPGGPPESVLRDGLGRVRLPGRFEIAAYGPVTAVLDVFHNRDGARAVREALDAVFPGSPVRLVIGMAADKDAREVARLLAPRLVEAIAVRPDFGGQDREIGAGDVAPGFRAEGIPVVDGLPNEEAFERAIAGTHRGEVLLVGGSFRTVAEFIARERVR